MLVFVGFNKEGFRCGLGNEANASGAQLEYVSFWRGWLSNFELKKGQCADRNHL